MARIDVSDSGELYETIIIVSGGKVPSVLRELHKVQRGQPVLYYRSMQLKDDKTQQTKHMWASECLGSNLALLLTGYTVLDNLLSLSKPQFSNL